ncbi:MAG: hypothetical protein JSV70_00825 [bacterium]|nr:MAG: hypothetical protein JSV70_00825 [bacterium]
MKTLWKSILAAVVALTAALLLVPGVPLSADAQELPSWLADRGRGVPTSLFGTYIEKGEFVVYPMYEYYKDKDEEYQPDELGYTGGAEFFAETEENEFLIFLGYGLTEDTILEFEAAVYTSKEFTRDPDDTASGTPPRIKESGLGDVEGQVRWRWNRETKSKPEYFSFFEYVFPFQENKKIIGTQDWEFAFGFGAIKGLSWGNMTGRVSVVWDGAERKVEPGEYAFEYLKKVSPSWSLVASVEGEDDEVSFIGETQHALSENATLKLNLGVGVTDKATDIAPEVGVLFRF